MASGTINLGSNKSNLEGRINWSSSSNGSNANTSNVWAEIQVRRNDGYTTTGTWNGALNIGGEEQRFSVHTSMNTGWITMKSFTKYNVPHSDNGSGSCYISGYCNGPSGTSMAGATVSGSQTVTLDKIARYLSITGFSIQTRQINKVVVKWSVSDARDRTQYSLNGAAWQDATNLNVASDNKSGTFEVLNLNPNTTYNLRISCKRADSQLWTESSAITFTTYDYAKLTSVPNVNIGSSQKIVWTNPNNATTSLKLCKTNNSQIISYGTVTGTTKTVTPTASTIYALTPNSNTYKARYIITTTQNGKTYTHSKDFTFNVTNSNPTFNNFTYIDSNSSTVKLTGNNKYLIKSHSSVKATISTANKATAKNSATMKTYRLSVGTKTKDASYNSNTDVSIELTNIDNNTIIVYAIDSRNNSTSKSITAEKYIDYKDIVISNINLARANGGVGQEVTLTYSGYIWNGNFGTENNAITSIKYQYRKTNSNDWVDGKTVLNPTISGNSFSQTVKIQGDLDGEGFDRQNAYEIKIIINDKLSSNFMTTIMPSGIPLYAYSKYGIAINAPFDESINAALQVNGNISVPYYDEEADNDRGYKVMNHTILKYAGDITFNKNSTYLSTGRDGGKIYFRPNGPSSSKKQASIDSNGVLYLSDKIYARINEVVYSAKSLYENTSGNNGTITLSESVANFTYIEIFYFNKEYGTYSSVQVYSPNNKKVNLHTSNVFGGDKTALIDSRKIKISGTSISNDEGTNNDYGSLNTRNNSINTYNRMYITKIIGYR